jgi:hypothetical protein
MYIYIERERRVSKWIPMGLQRFKNMAKNPKAATAVLLSKDLS